MLMKVFIVLPLCSYLFTCVHSSSVNTTDEQDDEEPPTASRLLVNDFWTRWFDVDEPGTGSGDYETVDAITSQLGTSICPSTHRIEKAQCNDEGYDYDDGDINTDNLELPCTEEGLICRNRDQPSGRCNNYQIRFYCEVDTSKDGGERSIRFDMRVYIILAVVPIAIFFLRICWSCTFERRRRRLRRLSIIGRRREDSVQIDPELFMPPPSYGDLFGQGGQPFALSRHYSLCGKCKTSRCLIFRNRYLRNSQRRRSQVSVASNLERVEETPEVSEPSDSVDTQSTTVNIDPNTTENATFTNVDLSGNDNDTPPTVDSSGSSATGHVSDSSEEESVRNSVTETVTDAQCDCPCHKNLPEVLAYDNPSFAPEVEIQDGRSRRMPGMHLSVFSLFRSSSLDEPPPPTYKEALKILKISDKGSS